MFQGVWTSKPALGRRKPSFPFRLVEDHPLTANLVGFWVPTQHVECIHNYAVGFRDQYMIPSGSPSIVWDDEMGPVIDLNSSTPDYYVSQTSDQYAIACAQGSVTVCAWYYPDVTTQCWLSTQGAGSKPWRLQTDTRFRALCRTDTEYQDNGPDNQTQSAWNFCTLRYNGSELQAWANGSTDGTPTSCSGALYSSTTAPITIGRQYENALFPFDGRVALLAVWHRALEPTEWDLLRHEKTRWDILETFSSRFYFSTAVTGGADVTFSATMDSDVTFVAPLEKAWSYNATLRSDVDFVAPCDVDRGLVAALDSDVVWAAPLEAIRPINATLDSDVAWYADIDIEGSVTFAATMQSDVDFVAPLEAIRPINATIDSDVVWAAPLEAIRDLSAAVDSDVDFVAPCDVDRGLAAALDSDVAWYADLEIAGSVDIAATMQSDVDFVAPLEAIRPINATIDSDVAWGTDWTRVRTINATLRSDVDFVAPCDVDRGLAAALDSDVVFVAAPILSLAYAAAVDLDVVFGADLSTIGAFKAGTFERWSRPASGDSRTWERPSGGRMWRV